MSRLFSALLFTLALHAQEANQGTISGYIYDQTQSVVPGAEITVTNRGTGLARTAKAERPVHGGRASARDL